MESPMAIKRNGAVDGICCDVACGVLVASGGVAAVTTRQLRLSSQPKPSPSGSLDASIQFGSVGTPGAAAGEGGVAGWLEDTTKQLEFCSQPNPSPSESLLALWQTGKPGLLVTSADADCAVTRQDWLFSHPHPSPSESNNAELQTGLEANTGAWLPVSNVIRKSAAILLARVLILVRIDGFEL